MRIPLVPIKRFIAINTSKRSSAIRSVLQNQISNSKIIYIFKFRLFDGILTRFTGERDHFEGVVKVSKHLEIFTDFFVDRRPVEKK
jgi:hypothetical protein